MNERIQKLSKEAFEYALSQRPGSDDFHPTWTEKFAELIVRECAGIYEKIDNGNQHLGTDDYLEALHKTFRS